jgi:glycosyltransferase involved in cell wall biosynthesis
MTSASPRLPASVPRILFLDDNIRAIGGHYLELAGLLCDGAAELGYESELIANEAFCLESLNAAGDDRLAGHRVDSAFPVRRMERWSLGVDGASRVARDLDGRPIGGTRLDRMRQRLTDRFHRFGRRPGTMLEAWAETFERAVIRFQPRVGDRIVVNTGSDFQMLALAGAVRRLQRSCWLQPLNIHVIFHFAVFESVADPRSQAFGRQVRDAIDAMPGHRVMLHATTRALAGQLAAVGLNVGAIPYPTRFRGLPHKPHRPAGRPKVLLAGIPRAEKGKVNIRSVLRAIEPSLLRSGRLTWSMQVPAKRWRRYLPESMYDLVDQGASRQSASAAGALELLHGNLTVQQYHRWLDGADLGLFLYAPERYAARCSGVLLEMMIRGVPVIVPDGCWLADQVRQADAGGPIGWIYRDVEHVPKLLEQAGAEIGAMRRACREHAATIARRHRGSNTLREMGVPQLGSQATKAAG